MLIFVDESGTFTPTENVDAFSVVAAYVIPEDQLTSANNALLNLKKACGVSSKEELKLRNVTNDRLSSFLAELSNLDGILLQWQLTPPAIARRQLLLNGSVLSINYLNKPSLSDIHLAKKKSEKMPNT